GERCDEDMDECLHSPCAEGSICHNTNGSYECICPKGRTGNRCEAASCSRDQECLNGGFCELVSSHNECICQPDFDGPNCERNYTDPCASPNQCPEYQVCLRNRSEMRGFSCVCRPGLSGRFCDTPIDNHQDIPYNDEDTVTEKTTHTMTDVPIVVYVSPEYLVRKVDDLLNPLSQRLRTTVKIKTTNGEMDVFEWNSITGQGARVGFGARSDARAEYRNRAKRHVQMEQNGVLVILQRNRFQIDLAECSKRCFKDAQDVAQYLAAMEVNEPLNPAMPIHIPLIMKD
ncbi:hypothetical protein PENTCL1PPCAC_1539, partial [Pristionchus entomophagus]